MKMTGNTILMTGGSSGIGRALAETLHARGNAVIITGRRKALLEEVAKANPGMEYAVFDVANLEGIEAFAKEIGERFPSLNVLVNNAGIMKAENLLDPNADFSIVTETVTTNLLAPLKLTAALLPLLEKQPAATVMTVTSGLAYAPLALTPTYNATKAAIHSWTQSLRLQLKKTNVEVLELVPPYVQTELMGAGQKSDPRAMPLDEFIAEVMSILEKGPEEGEICVQRVYPLRFSAEQGRKKYTEFVEGFNAAMSH